MTFIAIQRKKVRVETPPPSLSWIFRGLHKTDSDIIDGVECEHLCAEIKSIGEVGLWVSGILICCKLSDLLELSTKKTESS